MSALTANSPDDQHERLRLLAAHRGVSLDRPVDELFAAKGDLQHGLVFLDARDHRRVAG